MSFSVFRVQIILVGFLKRIGKACFLQNILAIPDANDKNKNQNLLILISKSLF